MTDLIYIGIVFTVVNVITVVANLLVMSTVVKLYTEYFKDRSANNREVRRELEEMRDHFSSKGW